MLRSKVIERYRQIAALQAELDASRASGEQGHARLPLAAGAHSSGDNRSDTPQQHQQPQEEEEERVAMSAEEDAGFESPWSTKRASKTWKGGLLLGVVGGLVSGAVSGVKSFDLDS